MMSAGCYVYLLRAGTYAKIGIADDIPRRVAQLQTACPERIVVESFKWVCCRTHALEIEAELHRHPTSKGLRTSGEWFQGDTWIESYFEYHYGHRVSLCRDAGMAEQMARLFVGVSMVLDMDKTESGAMYPICGSCIEIAPASDMVGDTLLGYAITYETPEFVTVPCGWYTQTGDVLRIALFDGTWSETNLTRWNKAIRDLDSVRRNATVRDPRFLLADGGRR